MPKEMSGCHAARFRTFEALMSVWRVTSPLRAEQTRSGPRRSLARTSCTHERKERMQVVRPSAIRMPEREKEPENTVLEDPLSYFGVPDMNCLEHVRANYEKFARA